MVDLNQLNYSASDQSTILQALTVRKLPSDFATAITLLQSKITPNDLTHCFEFLLSRDNIKDDHLIITALVTGGV